jgi:hypothetical protein
VLDEQTPAGGKLAIDHAEAVEVALEGPAKVHLPGEVPAVANPHRVRARAQLHAELQTFDVVLDRLAADGGIRV